VYWNFHAAQPSRRLSLVLCCRRRPHGPESAYRKIIAGAFVLLAISAAASVLIRQTRPADGIVPDSVTTTDPVNRSI
jgi:hypothetical protein